jgi:hypothetical protein
VEFAVLTCIDGSGPDDDAEYAATFAHSFLRQLDSLTTQQPHWWYRGPNMTGGHQVSLSSVAQQIRRQYDLETADDQPTQVFLAGYSRGAAGVVHVAYLLERMGIAVDGLFLLDAVDRSSAIGNSLPAGNVDVVPRNVVATYHAMRSPLAESRDSFSNTATSAAPPGSYRSARFLTTHGGMGGVPWGYAGLERGRWSLGDEYMSPSTSAARRAWIRRHGLILEHDELGGGLEMIGAALAGEASDAYTTLTMEQEESGAQACIQWMWPHLVDHGVVPPSSQARVYPNLGSFGRERF